MSRKTGQIDRTLQFDLLGENPTSSTGQQLNVAASGRKFIAPDRHQKRKRGKAASYKPSVLANKQRVVLAHDVDPSQENALIPELLKQSQRVSGEMARDLLLDAGY